MEPGPHDPRNIPILTDTTKEPVAVPASIDATAVHAAILSQTFELADSLLHQAVKDIEATLFQRVFDRLRAQLPELVERILREHAATREQPKDHG